MTDQTNASLIAEAREAAKRADWYMTGESPLLRALADALEAAEQERDEARKVAEDHALDADAVHVRLSAELREVNQERDNWKMSAEEAERAEKRWKDRAVEAERERDRLDEAFDRDLPWRYDEVEAQRNQLAAVVEKARAEVEGESGWFRYRAEQVSTVLAASPADVLREVKAAAWDEGNRAARLMLPTDPPRHPENPYRTREEQDRG